MTRKTQILTAILLFTGISAFPASTSKPPVVSEATLLHEMTDRDALARLPYPAYTTRQFSSYDRKAVSPDQPGWFGNDDWSMFIRINERAAAELLEQAADLMAQAKACHDELETYYRAAVDFGKVDEAAAQCAGMLGLA